MSDIGFSESDFYLIFFAVWSVLIVAMGLLFIVLEAQSRRRLREFQMQSLDQARTGPPIPWWHGIDELCLDRLHKVWQAGRSGCMLGTSHWSISRFRILAFFRSILELVGRLLSGDVSKAKIKAGIEKPLARDDQSRRLV